MSHCGPLTTNLAGSITSLRICTPLLPLHPLPFMRTWNCSSKSPYCFLLHRKVLNLRPLGKVEPMISPSFRVQYSLSPSQLAGLAKPPLPPAGMSSPETAPARSSAATRPRPMVWLRMVSSKRVTRRVSSAGLFVEGRGTGFPLGPRGTRVRLLQPVGRRDVLAPRLAGGLGLGGA